MKMNAIHRVEFSGSGVVFKELIEDPDNNPFPTPSGKIEIYSQQIADMENLMSLPIPKHMETWVNRNDQLAEKYPLQLITTHPMLRVHSQFYDVAWLAELDSQVATINAGDAESRGIGDGDRVRVFNDCGETVVSTRVTEGMMPGVVDIPEGVWYSLNERDIDQAGSVNVLTRDEASLVGALTSNTCLAQIQRS